MILTLLFIITLIWFVTRGIRGKVLADLLQKANEIKPRVELIVPVKKEAENNHSIHLNTFLDERREQIKKNRIQEITLKSIEENKETVMHLN